MSIITTIRDSILLLLDLPTPSERDQWKELAERMTMKHDALKRQMDERYETAWRLTKDGTRQYRRVATKVLTNRWSTESVPVGVPLQKARALDADEQWDRETNL